MILMYCTFKKYSKTELLFKKFHLLLEIVQDALAHGPIPFFDTTVLESLHAHEKLLYRFSNRQNTLDIFNLRVKLDNFDDLLIYFI